MFNQKEIEKPSGPVVQFVEFLEHQGYNPWSTSVADICCGKGRNSIYLASRGFNTVGMDNVEEVIEEARDRVQNKGVQARFRVWDVTEGWPYPGENFDAIIDCNGTTCIANPGRDLVVAEAYRTMKPGGFYLFYGPEVNSGIFPNTREELLETYNRFELVKLDEIPGVAIFKR